QKIRNLQRDPRITVMAEEGEAYFDLRGVQINGRAHLTTDPVAVLQFGERLYERQFGLLGEAARASVASSARKRTGVTGQPLPGAPWGTRRGLAPATPPPRALPLGSPKARRRTPTHREKNGEPPP